jgi:hypothetical protein
VSSWGDEKWKSKKGAGSSSDRAVTEMDVALPVKLPKELLPDVKMALRDHSRLLAVSRIKRSSLKCLGDVNTGPRSVCSVGID